MLKLMRAQVGGTSTTYRPAQTSFRIPVTAAILTCATVRPLVMGTKTLPVGR